MVCETGYWLKKIKISSSAKLHEPAATWKSAEFVIKDVKTTVRKVSCDLGEFRAIFNPFVPHPSAAARSLWNMWSSLLHLPRVCYKWEYGETNGQPGGGETSNPSLRVGGELPQKHCERGFRWNTPRGVEMRSEQGNKNVQQLGVYQQESHSGRSFRRN